MTVKIAIHFQEITPAVMNSYGDKVVTPEKYVAEKYEIEADTVPAAIHKAKAILDLSAPAEAVVSIPTPVGAAARRANA